MAVPLMLGLLFAFLAIGVPVGVCMILPILIMIIVDPVTSAEFITSSLYSGVASYTMLAIPFFILGGDIMNVGGLSRRLVKIANCLIGSITGSLGMVTVVACMFFGAVSGSAPATVAAIGAIMLPEMVRNGYSKYYAVGLITVAGSLGVIVPPSIPMVIYGVTLGVSISDLFLCGLVPAFMVGGMLIAINYVYCKKNNIVGQNKFSFKALLVALKEGVSALLMPVIILGGIYGGVFTVTEASVISCTYGIIVGLIYKEISLAKLFEEFRLTSSFVGGTLLTLAPSAALGQIFVILGVNRSITGLFTGISDNRFIVMGLVFVIMFFAGMFVQTTPMIVILGPLLLNVVEPYGVTALQFGLIMVLALCVAFCSPPVAVNLFVSSSMTGIPIDKIVKPMMPFFIGLIGVLLLLMFVPSLITIPLSLLN